MHFTFSLITKLYEVFSIKIPRNMPSIGMRTSNVQKIITKTKQLYTYFPFIMYKSFCNTTVINF